MVKHKHANRGLLDSAPGTTMDGPPARPAMGRRHHGISTLIDALFSHGERLRS